MERDSDDEPPKKKPRQSYLGRFGFTINQTPAIALPVPVPAPLPPPPSLICSYCSKSFRKINGRSCHEQFCEKHPMNIRALEVAAFQAEQLLPLFDRRAWCKTWKPLR